jgi:DNA-binding HxlR family transcriptional regulator
MSDVRRPSSDGTEALVTCWYRPRVQDSAGGGLVDCPTRLAIEILADKWSALILFALRSGPRRHGDLVGDIGGISRKVLTETLRRLDGYGLVARTEEPGRRIAYRLTELGATLIDPIETLNDWGRDHSAEIADALDRTPSGAIR